MTYIGADILVAQAPNIVQRAAPKTKGKSLTAQGIELKAYFWAVTHQAQLQPGATDIKKFLIVGRLEVGT